MKTIITEDWQRDALRVIIVDHPARQVSTVQMSPHLPTPMLQMALYDPENVTAHDEQEPGILLPLAVARELYEALGRHYGDHQDPASRELVDALKVQAQQNGERLDTALDALVQVATRPATLITGGTVHRADMSE